MNMSEILYKLTSVGYNFLWQYSKDHPAQYRDPNTDFDAILSTCKNGPCREDSGLKITGSLSIPPANDSARHMGDECCLDFYKSMGEMTQRTAIDPMILTYINHFHIHEYSVSRWEFKPPTEISKFINNHWFSTSHRYRAMMNTAGRLWWMAHMATLAAKSSDGRLTAHEIIDKFSNGPEYYNRSLQLEVLRNPALLAEVILILIDNPGLGIKQYRSMIMAVNRECGARLLDALSNNELKRLTRHALDGTRDADKPSVL